MAYDIGAKIGVSGWQEFRRQLGEINKNYKSLTDYSAALAKQMAAEGKSLDALSLKKQVQERQMKLLEQKYESVSEILAKAREKYSENSTAVMRLEGALVDVNNAMSDLKTEMASTEREMRDIANGIDLVGDAADDADEKVLGFGDMLKAGIASGAVLGALERAGDVIVEIGSASIEAAAEVKAANAQFSQTFGALEGTATSALRSISEETGIATTRLQGGYTALYAFTKSVGGDQQTALNIAQRALTAAADSAAYYDRSMEDATETLQSFLKGNYENDAALGIAATETSRNAKANELYAKSFKDLTEAQKVDTLLAMVEAGNAASGALGQAAREADSWANVTGELAESWRQLLASLGGPVMEGLIPIIQGITEGLRRMTTVAPWQDLNKGVEGFLDGITGAGKALEASNTEIAATAGLAGQYVDRLRALEQAGLTTDEAMREYAATVALLNELMPQLNLTIDDGTGRLEQNTDQIYSNIHALKDQAREQAQQAYYAAIVEELTSVQKDRYAAEMRLYELQQKQEELVRNGAQAIDMLAYSQAAATGTADQFWASLSEQDKALFEVTLELNQTKQSLEAYDAEIERHEGKLDDAIDAQKRMADSSKNLEERFRESFSGMKIGMDDSMRDILNRARSLGYDTGAGIAKGVRDAIPEVESAFTKLAKRGQGAYMHTLDQHSPSRVMRAAGKDSGLGAALGVEDAIPRMEKAMGALAAAGQNQYLQDQLSYAAQYPSMVAGSPGYGGAVTTSTTRNVAYGGISININTQPGQDARGIADAVLEQLTIQLGREETAFE